MIISSRQVNAVLKAQSDTHKGKDSPCTTRCPLIQFMSESSVDSQVVDKVKEVIQNEDEIRRDKVDTLKAKINHGDYPISGQIVAEKMVDRSLVDSILGVKDFKT